MDSARADILAAESHLKSGGWIARKAESFRHLPPPALEQWQGSAASAGADDAPPLAGSGWTLHPLGHGTAGGIEARRLDALDPAQRDELFAGLPAPGEGSDEGEAAPFAWAHRALCRQGLRLRIAAAGAAAARDAVRLHLRHRPHTRAEAPLLVLDIEAGARCVLLETHEHHAPARKRGLAQNLQIHIRLGRGASLQHLRIVAPGEQDLIAHHVHATLEAEARYAQAVVAGGSHYHLQRCTLALQGAGAVARNAALLLTGSHGVDQQIFSRLNAARTASQVETLALASDGAHAVANAYTRIAPGADDADVRQLLKGIALDGQPRLVLRPHLEILHDQVQAVHGATWGTLSEDALFYAGQRGLDDAGARLLIIEGMARALLERCLDAPDPAIHSDLLAQWLDSGWLARAIARRLIPTKEPLHG